MTTFYKVFTEDDPDACQHHKKIMNIVAINCTVTIVANHKCDINIIAYNATVIIGLCQYCEITIHIPQKSNIEIMELISSRVDICGGVIDNFKIAMMSKCHIFSRSEISSMDITEKVSTSSIQLCAKTGRCHLSINKLWWSIFSSNRDIILLPSHKLNMIQSSIQCRTLCIYDTVPWDNKLSSFETSQIIYGENVTPHNMASLVKTNSANFDISVMYMRDPTVHKILCSYNGDV